MATLTKKTVTELRVTIDCALLPETRRRLSLSAVTFLHSIRGKLTGPAAKLSKKQRETTEAILAKAFSDDPVVILEGPPLADLANLIVYATGDGRVSAFEENVMVTLKRRLGEPTLAVSQKQWRVVEEIKQKTYFGRTEQPPLIDPDGLDENEDPDGLPPERDSYSDLDWTIAGVGAGDDW